MKFLGYSSKLYDPRFSEVLTKKGQLELQALKNTQEALFEIGSELEVQRKAGVDVSQKQEDRLNELIAAVGRRLTKMQLDKSMVKANYQLKVAKQLQMVNTALRGLVRGGEMLPEDYEIITGDDRFGLPQPKEPVFTGYEPSQPIDETGQQAPIEFGQPNEAIGDDFYDFLDDI